MSLTTLQARREALETQLQQSGAARFTPPYRALHDELAKVNERIRALTVAPSKPLIEHKWRPTFGATPSNRLAVPPQTSAPLLELKVQVLDEPAAQRHAAELAGQTALTFGQPPDRCPACSRRLVDFGPGPICPTCDRKEKS